MEEEEGQKESSQKTRDKGKEIWVEGCRRRGRDDFYKAEQRKLVSPYSTFQINLTSFSEKFRLKAISKF